MVVTIAYCNFNYKANLSEPLDISLPLTSDGKNPVAWYLNQPVIEPVKMGDWTGKVSEGSSTNFNNICFNPHAHGTHTECLGHITRDFYSVNQVFKKHFFTAELISITPKKQDEDSVITKAQVQEKLQDKKPEAIVLRTLPNATDKKHKNYSHTNPPYLSEEAALYIRELGIEHLLIDLPSVDREEDGGRLLAHKAFWNIQDVNSVNADARYNATITEMIFVTDTITDGSYLLNLQLASFENDASPSRPVLYKMTKETSIGS